MANWLTIVKAKGDCTGQLLVGAFFPKPIRAHLLKGGPGLCCGGGMGGYGDGNHISEITLLLFANGIRVRGHCAAEAVPGHNSKPSAVICARGDGIRRSRADPRALR
jgi:hypothetical protein